MATWPTGMCPLAGSYNETPPNNTIRTSMDRGPDKVRRRTTANVRPISFKMLLTKTQLATFENFFQNETFSGAEAFDYTHPRTGAAVRARFVNPPSWSDRGRSMYDVQVQLEILP